MPSWIVGLDFPFYEGQDQQNKSDESRVNTFCRDHLYIPPESIEWRAVTKKVNNFGDNEWRLSESIDKDNSYFIYVEKKDAQHFFNLSNNDQTLSSNIEAHFQRKLETLYGLYGEQKTKMAQKVDFELVTNRAEFIDDGIAERLYAHGLKAVFTEHKNDLRRRSIGALNSILVGYDTGMSESEDDKKDIDSVRVNRFFSSMKSNHVDLDPYIWFPVRQKIDHKGEVSFSLVIGADGFGHEIDYQDPFFIYIKKETALKHYGSSLQALNKSQMLDVIDRLKNELESLADRINERNYSVEISPQKGWRVGHIHLSKVNAYLSDDKDKLITDIHNRINRAIDKVNNPENTTVKVKMAFKGDYTEGESAPPLMLFSTHMREQFKIDPLVGLSYLNNNNNELVLNVNLDVMPAFKDLNHSQDNLLYTLIQSYIEKAIKTDPIIGNFRWDFAKTLLTSKHYQDWSPILLTSLFASFVSNNPLFEVVSVDYLGGDCRSLRETQ